MKKYVLNKRGKLSAETFLHYTGIVIFVLMWTFYFGSECRKHSQYTLASETVMRRSH